MYANRGACVASIRRRRRRRSSNSSRGCVVAAQYVSCHSFECGCCCLTVCSCKGDDDDDTIMERKWSSIRRWRKGTYHDDISKVGGCPIWPPAEGSGTQWRQTLFSHRRSKKHPVSKQRRGQSREESLAHSARYNNKENIFLYFS